MFRKSGEPYITHPLNVAYNLISKLNIYDIDSICVALLHDTVEDNQNITIKTIKDEFGVDIANLVEGMTKVGHVQYRWIDRQIETLRRMFIYCAKDIRVIFIRLADRLHNMYTIQYLREDKRKRIAKETLEIYVAIAERLNLWGIKSELEEECFKVLYPDDYKEINTKLNNILGNTKYIINSITKSIKLLLLHNNIKADVSGRIKNPYSIFKKMKLKNYTFENIYDIFGIRVIVENVQDCYTVLGLIHTKYQPIPNKFKDYIAVPKVNGYQSLHTTVIIPKQTHPVEIQIRTIKMHEVAEYGMASHIIYSDKKTAVKADKEKIMWLKNWAYIQKTLSSGEYIDDLKIELLNDDKVYVFTPKGDIKYLPKDSTPLDFAYLIHTEIGNRYKCAMVNNKIVPINYNIKNGDTINIITSNDCTPNINWINIVKTAQAKHKIKQYFSSLDTDKHIEEGKKLIDKELKILGKPPLSNISESKKKNVATSLSYKTFNDLLTAVGSLSIKPSVVISKLFPTDKLFKDISKDSIKPKLKDDVNVNNILIDGKKNILFELSKCCNPQYPNDICGYVVSNGIVKIHKSDCDELKHMNINKLIHVEWESKINKLIKVCIDIEVNNVPGILMSITEVLFKYRINIDCVKSENLNKKNKTIIHMCLDLKDLTQYEQMFHSISNINGVLSIKRVK